MKIKATFKGSFDPEFSMGFIVGKKYILEIKGKTISCNSSPIASCEYSNIQKFLENWTKIKSL